MCGAGWWWWEKDGNEGLSLRGRISVRTTCNFSVRKTYLLSIHLINYSVIYVHQFAHGYLFSTLGYSLIHYLFFQFFQLWSLGDFLVGSSVLLPYISSIYWFIFLFRASLLSEGRCFRFILYFLVPALESTISLRIPSSFIGKLYLEYQDLSTVCAYCYWVSVPWGSLKKALGNIYMYTKNINNCL